MSTLDSGFFFKKNSLFYQLLELSSFHAELSMNCWFRALFNQFNLKKKKSQIALILGKPNQDQTYQF